MTPIRLVARLDIKGPNVVKGIHLEGLRVVGAPGALAKRYYEQGIDEIVYMDIVASLYGRNNILAIVRATAAEVFVPLTVGGGLRCIEDIVEALHSGADKVAINTAAIARPAFLREAAETFGSQSIVLSIEAKQRGPGRWEAFTNNGREATGVDALDWVVEAERLGVGEVLVTSVDREGTGKGFDIDLLAAIRSRVRVPVIASGGAGAAGHIVSILKAGAADAIACASVLHYERDTIGGVKQAIRRSGFEVRL